MTLPEMPKIGELGSYMTFAGLIMTRLSVVVSMIPFLVSKGVPSMVRVGVAMTLTLFVYPILLPQKAAMPTEMGPIMILYLKEGFYGMAIGFSASIIFHAFEAAGAMVDNQRGAAQARLLIPQLGESSIFGNMNYLLGIVLFLSLDGHLLFLKVLIESYEVLPVLTFPKAFPGFITIAEEFIHMTSQVLLLSLQLTAPVMISIFVVDVILGIISKAAPAINVWELGFAVRGILGVILFWLAFQMMAAVMAKLSLQMIPQVRKIIEFFSISPIP